MANRKSRFSSQ